MTPAWGLPRTGNNRELNAHPLVTHRLTTVDRQNEGKDHGVREWRACRTPSCHRAYSPLRTGHRGNAASDRAYLPVTDRHAVTMILMWCLSRLKRLCGLITGQVPGLVAGLASRPFARFGMTALFMGISTAAVAHPHVWIAYSAQLQMDGATVTGVAQTWRFTKGFPVKLIGIDSLPDDGPLDEKQTAVLKQQAFASLAGVSYFSHLFVDGKTQRFLDPNDFHVSIDHGRIEYTFTLKLVTPVTVSGHDVELGIWDDSFFVAYSPDTQPAITTTGHPASTCSTRPFADHAHPIFNGIVVPQATAISC